MDTEKIESSLVAWVMDDIAKKEQAEKCPDNIVVWGGESDLHITGMLKPNRKNRILKGTLLIAILAFMIGCLVISFLPWIGFTAGIISMIWIGAFAWANGWLE